MSDRACTAVLAKAAFTRLVQRDQLACIEIRHPAFRADALLQGAQLIHYSPAGEDNWLWLSDEVEYRKGVSLRGGIPVCWPWFGNADKNPPEVQALMNSNGRLPAHGFARIALWQLTDLYEATDRVELEMTLKPDASTRSIWHGHAEARIRWVFSKAGMRMTISTRNTGNAPLAFTQALHSYFPTTDIHRTRLDGLHGSAWLDTLEGWRRKRQQGAITFTGETDRVYFHADGQTLTLTTPGQRLHIDSASSRSCIVWNPWIEKARRLGQFHPQAWQQMLCIETANAADDWVNLPAGGEHQMVLELKR